MDKIKIILAEDESALAMIIKESLETRNFEVTIAENGEIAIDLYLNQKPDILILDIMMPKKDGLSVAKQIRQIDKKIPIIFLTSKSQTIDVIEGFTTGGNDYIKKPFSMEELIVRINFQLGKITIANQISIYKIGNYTFNVKNQTLEFNNTIENLTHREAALLKLLVSNPNETLERSVILKKIWGNDDFFSGRSMDVFITKLRKKLSLENNVQIINIRGQGYKLIS